MKASGIRVLMAPIRLQGLAAALCALAVMVAVGGQADARQFRKSNPITVPQKDGGAAGRQQFKLPGEPAAKVEPIDRGAILKAIRKMARDWNQGDLSAWLDSEFYNRERLLDTISSNVPRDANLRILSVNSVRTLAQSVEPTGKNKVLRTSTVSAVIEHQIEFNDPVTGFQKLNGRSEFLFKVAENLE